MAAPDGEPMGDVFGGFRFTTECDIDMGEATPIDPTYHGAALLALSSRERAARIRVGWEGGK